MANMTQAQLDNLKLGKPFTSDQDREKAAENGRKGGVASGIAKREKKIFREAILKRMKASDFDEIIDGMIERAKISRQAAADLADRIDGKPTETHENTTELTADIAVDAEAIRAEIWKRLQEET